MHDIETELRKALKIKKQYTDRQKLLTTILVAMDDRERFSDDDYDALSDEAAEWHKSAVAAKDAFDPIPDFSEEADEVEDEDETEDAVEDEAEDEEAEEASEDEDEPEEVADADEEPEAEADDTDDDDEGDDEEASEAAEDDEAAEAEPSDEDEDPSDSLESEDHAGSANGSTEDDDAEAEEDEVSRKLKKAAGKPVTKAKAKPEAKAPIKQKVAAKKPVKPSISPALKQGTFPNPDYDKIDGSKDRFGVIKGTKTHEAVRMYTKGASSYEIVERLGARHYNILKKLQREGHHVEKVPGGKWKLTHKDDYKPVKKKVK